MAIRAAIFLLGPRFSSADLSLQKTFVFAEKVHLDLKWDAFNAFNHTNLQNPNSRLIPARQDRSLALWTSGGVCRLEPS